MILNGVECMKNDILDYFDIITSVKTVSDRDALALEIDHFLDSIFAKETQTLDNILREISFNMGEKLKQIFQKKQLDISNKEAIKDCLSELKELLNKFRIIKLTVAFEPSSKTIEEIANFVSSKIGVGFILDIDTDETILGGAIVVYNGQYKNLSLRKSIEETFDNRKEEILPITA